MKFIIICAFFATFLVGCNSSKETIKSNRTNDSNNSQKLNTSDELNYTIDNTTGLVSSKKLGSSLQEGWVNDTTVQALIAGDSSISKDDLIQNGRKRLAWLLLLNSYDLSRRDKPLAARLAKSKLFANFGSEEIKIQHEGSKKIIIVLKNAAGLNKTWEEIMRKIEMKEPRLSALKRTKQKY